LTYIWVEESQIADEETATCPYCDKPIPLLGGAELSESLRSLQALLEDIQRQIAELPSAIDVHRFLFEQVDYIASTFNDRLDDIQEVKDIDLVGPADLGAKRAS
jgi:hypothetical protein